MATITETMIGNYVKFRSKHPSDDTIYEGTIKGLISYDIARNYNDLVNYRGQVYTQDSAIANLEDLNYFLMGLNEDDPNNERTISFASEFIDGVVTTVSSTGSVDIRIWGIDISTEPATIITALAAAGFNRAKILATRD